MRLCYVGNLGSVHTRRWAGFFAEKGHDVHVIATTTTPQNVDAGAYTVHPWPAHRTGSYLRDLLVASVDMPRSVLKLRQLLRTIEPDLVHVHYVNEAAFFAVLAGVHPLVLTAWGSDILISPEKSWVRKQVVKYTVRKADLVTCDADHMKRSIARLGADPERVQVIFFGTDVERYQPARRDAALRARIAPDATHLIISIRSLEPVYDVESLIRAIPAVRSRFPSAIFLVGGTGSQAGALQKLAVELGVEGQIRFLGALSQDDLPAYLASSDLYVSTALSDGGIAASTAEAMASGLPVVITDAGDNRQWVEDDLHGFLVPPADPERLAGATIRLLDDAAHRDRMGCAGREVIVERNNLYREMSRMEGHYQHLVAAGAKGA